MMAIEAWGRQKDPGVDGKTVTYYRVCRYVRGEQRLRDIRIRRPTSATAEGFRQFMEVVNEAVVDHARGIIDARGPGRPPVRRTGMPGSRRRPPTGCARYPLADGTRFEKHTLLPG
ncbi:hypothetical protein GTY67_26510 [Streptomyces sp. SID8374]|uniref:hypothetical protein n=1 Tax=Streptomyces sp. SID8374 TaxID=2690354 RepID=UPI001370FAC7|nr:hypothetical protein [Streptomyces sp. SID8374]MYX16904.1 hypothetical protein [Streptomyces sp. SID8374]